MGKILQTLIKYPQDNKFSKGFALGFLLTAVIYIIFGRALDIISDTLGNLLTDIFGEPLTPISDTLYFNLPIGLSVLLAIFIYTKTKKLRFNIGIILGSVVYAQINFILLFLYVFEKLDFLKPLV